jgi:hypothetical protein
MPISYHCDNCAVTAPTLDGWTIVSVMFLHDVSTAPPPGGRTLDLTAPDLMFHAAACRDAWCEAAGLTPPGGAPGKA